MRLALAAFTSMLVASCAFVSMPGVDVRPPPPISDREIMSGARPVDLQKGEADLALRVGPITDANLIARRVGEAGWALYASTTYLKRAGGVHNVDDLTGHDVIGFDRAMSESPPARWLADRLGGATVVHRSREMIDMRDAAVSGVGLAVLPCGLGDESRALKRVHPDVVATRPISIVYRRDARISAPVRAVIRFVVEVMAKNARLLSGSMAPIRSKGSS